ncbi:MAG: SRPBCC family protein [Gemmatimonadaceae bacterium]
MEAENWVEAENRGNVLPLVGAVGVGAALAYFLDPDRGERRRHLAADQVVHASRVATDAIGVTSRDLRNRSRGLAAGIRNTFADQDGDDVVIGDRVRAALGRLVSHPGAIEVQVENGRAILGGAVLADEADQLIAGVKKVRGIEDIEARFDRYDQPGDVPALQGTPRPPANKFELLQEKWTPATRLAATVAGGALAAMAIGRGDRGNLLTKSIGLAGLALFVRGAANKPFDQLLGIGAGRRAVTLQKTINIMAPVDEVFAWLTDWERWPEWMSHIREVRAAGETGDGTLTHWVVDGPAGTTVSWDSIVTRYEPQDIVAWKTVEGSPIAHAGVMRFFRNEDGSTRVDIRMSYNPILGAAGHAVAVAFGRDPKKQLDDDLARVKTAIETGVPAHDAAANRI